MPTVMSSTAQSAKGTPELAGEGIEYSWACAKGWYRQQPLKKKRKKDDFHNLVKVYVMPSTIVVSFDIRRRKLLCRVRSGSFGCSLDHDKIVPEEVFYVMVRHT